MHHSSALELEGCKSWLVHSNDTVMCRNDRLKSYPEDA